MTIAERIALAQEILDSVVADQPRVPLSVAKIAELDRRIAHDRANPDDGVPWEGVEAAARARFEDTRSPRDRDWLGRFKGSFRDEPAFDEVISLGRAFRDADRPPDPPHLET
jgi:putative addiction module component (TIGR02574 family)